MTAILRLQLDDKDPVRVNSAINQLAEYVDRSVGRTTLTASITYYVRTDGSDSNTGLVNSSGGAFLTIQRAVDVAVSTLDFAGNSVTINVIAGSYSAGLSVKPWIGGGALTFTGDTSTPANVTVSGSFSIDGSSPDGTVTLQGFKTTNGGIVANVPCTLNLGNWEFGANTSPGHHIFSNSGGANIFITSNYSISGGTPTYHYVSAWGGTIRHFGSHTVTLTGTPAFGTGFANVLYGGIIYMQPMTFTGPATGTRYLAQTNGVIDTNGGGANFFPGNAPGSAITGGQYT